VKQPNIIFITTGQQRFDTIQSHGAPTWTPHLNWLADNGISYTRGHGRPYVYGNCIYLHYLLYGHIKYCFESLDDTELLFNVSDDPEEREDLANDPTYHSRKSAMRSEVGIRI